MVRTQLPAPSFAIDLSRILALSAAIGLHLLAMLLLLIPLSHVAPPQAPAKAQPVWQQPIVVPITPPPPQPTVQPQKRPITQPRVPTAAPVPTPVQAALADASPMPVQDAIADPAAVAAEPSVPPTPVSMPVAGMQLQYVRACAGPALPARCAARRPAGQRVAARAGRRQGMPVQAYGLVPVNFSLGR